MIVLKLLRPRLWLNWFLDVRKALSLERNQHGNVLQALKMPSATEIFPVMYGILYNILHTVLTKTVR